MTPAEATAIDRREFEAECAAIRQRAYSLVDRRHVNAAPQPAPKPKPVPTPKKPGNRNGRPPKLYTVGNVSLPLSQWAIRLNTTTSALHQRMRKGWTILEVVTVPAGQRRPGVVDNLPGLLGTGGGRSSQAFPNIVFHDEAKSDG